MGRLIDIDRLCNDLAKRWSIADKKKEDIIRAVMADVVTPIVVSQPTVDAVPVRHGYWIKKRYWSEGVGMGESYGYWYACSECGAETKGDYTRCDVNFCSHCGAKMKG